MIIMILNGADYDHNKLNDDDDDDDDDCMIMTV